MFCRNPHLLPYIISLTEIQTLSKQSKPYIHSKPKAYVLAYAIRLSRRLNLSLLDPIIIDPQPNNLINKSESEAPIRLD